MSIPSNRELRIRPKNNVAAFELMRQLAVCYKTAWLMRGKDSSTQV